MHGCHGNMTFNKSYICLISSNTFTYSFCKLVSVLILVVVSVFTVFQCFFLCFSGSFVIIVTAEVLVLLLIGLPLIIVPVWKKKKKKGNVL